VSHTPDDRDADDWAARLRDMARTGAGLILWVALTYAFGLCVAHIKHSPPGW
jgi:hypothetical protein